MNNDITPWPCYQHLTSPLAMATNKYIVRSGTAAEVYGDVINVDLYTDTVIMKYVDYIIL